MTTAFATAIERLNSAVVSRLSGNAVSLDGVNVDAVFDNGFALGNVGPYGVATTGPRLTLQTASVPADVEGKACVVDSVAYTVAAHEPDGTGISVLRLELAA